MQKSITSLKFVVLILAVNTVTIVVLYAWHFQNCGSVSKGYSSQTDEKVIKLQDNRGRMRQRVGSRSDEKFNTPQIFMNTTEARIVKKKIRLLCWITSQWENLGKAHAVWDTWGQRCDKFVIVLSKSIAAHQTGNLQRHILLVDTPDGRIHLTAKSIEVVTHVHRKYLNQFDWFLKADDDSYFIIENLKYLLSLSDSNIPSATGRYFKRFQFNRTGYLSGGAGYVINRLALDQLVTNGIQKRGMCAVDGGAEDVEIGKCLSKTGTQIIKSIDRFSRQTFSPNSIMSFIVGEVPNYLYTYDRHKVLKGTDCCSQLSISFHYIDPKLMRVMDFLIYRLSVYGLKQDTDALKTLLTAEYEEPLPLS